MKLSERLAALISAWGALPDSAPVPNVGMFRGELIDLTSEAQTLENLQSSAEAKAQIASLQSENHSLKEQRNAQKKDYDALLATVNEEIDTLRKEKTDREEKAADFPKEQFWILETLPPESKGSLKMYELADAVGLPISEVEVHLDQLKSMQPSLVYHTHNQPISRGWYCTIAGTKCLMAMRAGDEHLKNKRSPKLDDGDERILAALKGSSAGATAQGIDMGIRHASNKFTADRVEARLSYLAGLRYAVKDGRTWKIAEGGIAYFGEHRGRREQ